MRRSIQWRFTVTFIALMALAVAATWCINTFWLEDYYLNNKIKVLESAYTEIDSIVQEEQKKGEGALDGLSKGNNSADSQSGDSGAQDLAQVVRHLREASNVTMLIYDSIKDKALVYSANDIGVLKDRVSQYILGRDDGQRTILKQHDNYMIQKTFDPRNKTYYLESWGFFSDNGTVFIMTMPLAGIEESAKISNQFLMYSGIAVILAASVLLYFTTRRITSPIHKLSDLSEQMSKLDFDAKYVDSRHAAEEISTLGNSMNALSDRLKETIEELKTANQELQLDIEQKIQVDELRKDFIADVSHELKTPIALIQGYAEGLTEGMAEDKESRDYYCEVIADEANKMNKMVKQLLALTALEFGREQVEMARFNLTELIAGVISNAGILLRQKGISLEFDGSIPYYVWGDEFQIEEVVTNYLSNAINHAEGANRILVGIEKNGGEVRAWVFNTGTNIPEADLPNLWNKFFKVDKARTRAYGGSGIGLSIVKAIIERHHKAYGVRNLDGGVEFWFTLDCRDDLPA